MNILKLIIHLKVTFSANCHDFINARAMNFFNLKFIVFGIKLNSGAIWKGYPILITLVRN